MKIDVAGGWVELRSPDEVPEKLRRPLLKMSISGVPKAAVWEAATENPQDFDGSELIEMIDYGQSYNDLCIVALVKQWSFEFPISVEGIGNLGKKAYQDINNACAPFISALLPEFGVDPDPKAITENS